MKMTTIRHTVLLGIAIAVLAGALGTAAILVSRQQEVISTTDSDDGIAPKAGSAEASSVTEGAAMSTEPTATDVGCPPEKRSVVISVTIGPPAPDAAARSREEAIDEFFAVQTDLHRRGVTGGVTDPRSYGRRGRSDEAPERSTFAWSAIGHPSVFVTMIRQQAAGRDIWSVTEYGYC